MKILHIWNTAGVASLIAKTQRKHGHDVKVMMRSSHDPFRFTKYYGDVSLEVTGGAFITECLKEAADYDIIHVHSSPRILQNLREAYPDKKIILQHHGTELINGDFVELQDAYKYCDQIITSTKDLTYYLNSRYISNTYIANAVDTDLFKPNDYTKEGALYIGTRYISTDWMLHYTEELDYDIYIIDREEDFIPTNEMPELLNNFELYVDIKCPPWLDGKPVKAISKTALEALACGLKVFNYEGKIIDKLPIDNTPEYQYGRIMEVYKK